MNLNFNPNQKFKITTDQINQLWNQNEWYEIELKDTRTIPSVESQVNTVLTNLLNPETGIIDGNDMKNIIFPTGNDSLFPKFDVFISHSHNDNDAAERLSDILTSEYGKTPFLDKYVWGSADNLLRKIDDKYCRFKNNSNFNYTKRNFSSSHVHTMLSMAILEMIAKCSSFIFIESSESLDYNLFKENGEKHYLPGYTKNFNM